MPRAAQKKGSTKRSAAQALNNLKIIRLSVMHQTIFGATDFVLPKRSDPECWAQCKRK